MFSSGASRLESLFACLAGVSLLFNTSLQMERVNRPQATALWSHTPDGEGLKKVRGMILKSLCALTQEPTTLALNTGIADFCVTARVDFEIMQQQPRRSQHERFLAMTAILF
jgi:hypothetical protein